MPRLDDQPSFDPWLREKSEKEKMKEEIRAGVMGEMKKKKRKKTIACCSLGVIAALLFFGAIFSLVAKSGLFEIPVFSKIFTKTAAPQRVVSVTNEEIENFETGISEKLKTQVEPKIEPGATGQKVEVSLKFTEKELTGFLRSIESSNESPFRNSQVVVTPEEIEIFGEITAPNKTYLTVAFRPEIKDNELEITLKKIRLGTLSLPTSWGNFLVGKFLDKELQSAQNAIRKVGRLESISLGQGELTARGLVDVLIFTEQ
jgi:hypothetical protein